jgi:hypothetical protein
MSPSKRKPIVVITALGKTEFLLRYPASPRELLDFNALCSKPGIKEAALSPAERTLHIIFAPGKFKLARFVKQLKTAGANVVIKKGIAAENRLQFASVAEESNDILAAFIGDMAREANGRVRGGLNNRTDLTSIAPLALGLLGVLAFVRQPQMPKWNEFMWYAYSIFRDFHGGKGG